MLCKIVFGVAVLAIVHQFCYCDEHTFMAEKGNAIFDDKVLYRKEIFNQVNDEGVARSKNYTIIFKYMNDNSSTDVTRAIFNVRNAKSYGTIEVKTEDGKKTLQAMLNIVNGTNAVVTAEIFGPRLQTHMAGAGYNLGTKKPKTMTIVYGHNSTQTRNRKIVLGNRQPGDRVLDIQTKIVKYKYRFAESEFKYPQQTPLPNTPQPSVTAVEFSFDTSSAIAFLNSTFISENTVDAIVYDLNFPEFRANMTVYGYDSFNKPSTYKPIVKSEKNPF